VKLQDPGSVHVEGDDHTEELRAMTRVAVLASWQPDGRVSPSVGRLLRALQQAGFGTLLVSTAPGSDPLTWAGGRPPKVTVLRRPNLGHDFGSWATAFHRTPELLRCPALLLMNDSLVGPFTPLASVVERFLSSDAQMWGLTDSLELAPHVQSYCLGFKDGALQRRALRRFWSDVRVERDRGELVRRYEIGLSEIARSEGVKAQVAFSREGVAEGEENPTLHGWRRLLERGFPFVKRRVIREPEAWSPDEPVESVVRSLLGVELREWL
jgi:lipopolysaccharide biosynthesis protein